MAWQERNALESRNEFINEWLDKDNTVSNLCRRFNISRKTGYKWLDRYDEAGRAGLEERSHAPHNQPLAINEETAAFILEARQLHPTWGARKIRELLKRQDSNCAWPAASSIGELLKREGLIVGRRKRNRTPPYTQPLGHADAANRVWCADFKGWFLCGDGKRCDPLTITDAYSRYLLRCRVVGKTDGAHVQAVFEAVFREFGLPEAMRTDNGPPFASCAPGGLSRLSMWWMKLGIQHERIEPGCPEQNGRHERMHRTLKAETANPPGANLRRQQSMFQHFEKEYNQVRPHEAIGFKTPSDLYVGSSRNYPSRLPELEYPVGVHLRRISQQGSVKCGNARTYLSEVLAHETVGLLETGEQRFDVYYGLLLLGQLDARKQQFQAVRNKPTKRRNKGRK
jgi:putative transposase